MIGFYFTLAGTVMATLAGLASVWKKNPQQKRVRFIGIVTLVAGLIGVVGAVCQKYEEGIEAKIEKENRAAQHLETLYTITGGDSFCYLDLSTKSWVKNQFEVWLTHHGKYPLYDVEMLIIGPKEAVSKRGSATTNISLDKACLKNGRQNVHVGNIGNIATPTSLALLPLNTSSNFHEKYVVCFNARNGQWTQEIDVLVTNGVRTCASTLTDNYRQKLRMKYAVPSASGSGQQAAFF